MSNEATEFSLVPFWLDATWLDELMVGASELVEHIAFRSFKIPSKILISRSILLLSSSFF